MKKVLDVFKKPLWLLCLGLGIVLFASIFANMANTSLYSVSVTEYEFSPSVVISVQASTVQLDVPVTTAGISPVNLDELGVSS